jgi:hypothetical protein
MGLKPNFSYQNNWLPKGESESDTGINLLKPWENCSGRLVDLDKESMDRCGCMGLLARFTRHCGVINLPNHQASGKEC